METEGGGCFVLPRIRSNLSIHLNVSRIKKKNLQLEMLVAFLSFPI